MASQVEKLEADVHIKASAEKFHEVYYNRTYHLANICPDKIQGVDILEGEWGREGSIILWHYQNDGKACLSKDLLEAVDLENNKATLKALEGDTLKHWKSMKFTTHAIPQEEGSVVHWTMEYETLEGHIPDTHALMQLAIDITKDIGDYFVTQDEK